jgi:hypothetical protein
MEKWKSMFAVSADMCMTLQREIRRATSLPASRLKNFPMNGYVPYVALARKSFLLNNEKLIREGTFENLGRVDSRLLRAYWLHVFSMDVNNYEERFFGDEYNRCVI